MYYSDGISIHSWISKEKGVSGVWRNVFAGFLCPLSPGTGHTELTAPLAVKMQQPVCDVLTHRSPFETPSSEFLLGAGHIAFLFLAATQVPDSPKESKCLP